MSNLDGLQDQAEGLEPDAPAFDDGTVDDGTPPEDATPPEPQYDYLEVDDPSSKYVKVKIDGEEVDVPLSEALSGYSRQEDYTRKTQQLAQQRQEAEEALRLTRAFQANPGLTVQALAHQAGVSVEEYLGMTPREQQQATQENQSVEDQYADPIERELRQSTSRVEALEQRIAQQDADRELRMVTEGLKRQYEATDEEILAVVEQAVQNQMPMNMLPTLMQANRYQRSQIEAQAKAEATAQVEKDRQAAEQARRAQAQAAGQRVSTGSGAAASSVTAQPPASQRMSIREAAMAAFEAQDA